MRRRWMARTLAAVACGLGLVLLVAGLALADTPTPQPVPGPEAPQQGIDALLPGPDIRQGNQPTLAERYPAGAYVIFNVDVAARLIQGFTDPTGSSMNVLYSLWASEVMAVLLAVAAVTGRLLEWTFSLDVASGAAGPLGEVVGNLMEQVYRPLLPTALMLLAIWLVWQLLGRRRTLHGLQGIGWALVALVVAGLYASAPAQIMSAADGATAQASRFLLAAIGAADPRVGARAGDPSFASGDAADAELRMFVDRYWRTYVFGPWSWAELGTDAAGQRYGEELLAKQAGMPSRFDQDIEQAPQPVRDWYGGKNGAERLTIVSFALVTAVLSSVLYLVVAGAVVVGQMAFLLLLMLAPLFFLVGVQPGVGRRMLVRWAELVAGALLIRVLSAAFLSVVLVLGGVINEVGVGRGLLSGALQLVLVISAFVYRKPFLRVFGQVASPRLVASHLSHPRTAQTVHRGLDWVGRRLGRAAGPGQLARPAGGKAGAAATRATPGAASKASAAGAAGAGATGLGLALTALEAGKLGVRGAAWATRRAQGVATPFVVGGSQTPPQGSFSRSRLPRPAATGSRPAAATESSSQRRTERKTTEPKGRSYTHWRSGETVTVATSKIVLPRGWDREKRS